MILLLAHKGDREAAWLHEQLQDHTRIAHVTIEDLVTCHALSIGISRTGRTEFTFRTNDGRLIRSQSVTHILDRVQYLPPETNYLITAEDKNYALMEWQAIYTAITNCGATNIFNRSSPGALGGRSRPYEVWLSLALKSGFKNTPTNFFPAQDAQQEVIVFHDKVYQLSATSQHAEGCLIRFRELSSENILGVSYIQSQGGLFFVNACPIPPNLSFAGYPLIQDILKIATHDLTLRHTG